MGAFLFATYRQQFLMTHPYKSAIKLESTERACAGKLCERKTAAPRSSGFTLVELATSIVIVGILGAVAAPRMFDNNAFNDRGYTDEIASSLRYAQKIAIASQCDVQVTINANNYAAMQRTAAGNTCGGGAFAVPVLRTDGSALSGTAPPSVVLNPATTITFQTNGSTTAAPPVLTVGPFTLTVTQASGMVTVVP
jgi:MSHA pilin protein MshC